MSSLSDPPVVSPSPPVPAAADSHRFGLHWLAILPLILLAGVTIFEKHLLDRPVWIGIAWAVGLMIASALVAWLLVYGLWKLVGMSKSINTLVFCGLVLFVVLEMVGQSVTAWGSAKDHQAALVLDEVIDRTSVQFGSLYAGDARPETVREALNRIEREIESRRDAIDADEREFTQLGSVTLPRLISTQAIDKRLDEARRCLDANERFVVCFDALLTQLRGAADQAELKRIGLQHLPDQLAEQYQYTRQMRSAEAKVFKAEIDVLQFLRQHWGEWTYNRKVNDAMFPNPALQKEIDRLEDVRNIVVHQRDVISAKEAKRRAAAEGFRIGR